MSRKNILYGLLIDQTSAILLADLRQDTHKKNSIYGGGKQLNMETEMHCKPTYHRAAPSGVTTMEHNKPK